MRPRNIANIAAREHGANAFHQRLRSDQVGVGVRGAWFAGRPVLYESVITSFAGWKDAGYPDSLLATPLKVDKRLSSISRTRRGSTVSPSVDYDDSGVREVGTCSPSDPPLLLSPVNNVAKAVRLTFAIMMKDAESSRFADTFRQGSLIGRWNSRKWLFVRRDRRVWETVGAGTNMRFTERFSRGMRRSPRFAIARSFFLLLWSVPLTCCGAPDWTHSCIDTPKREFRDPSGVHIFIVDTACDTLGNDFSESIFASQGPGTAKQLLFKYGPDERSQLPKVSVRDGKTIVISVESILDVIFQATKYGPYTIVYEVNHIEYD